MMVASESGSFVEARKLGKQVATREGVLTLLDDINFSIDTGTSIAILGASGSGKLCPPGFHTGLRLGRVKQVTDMGMKQNGIGDTDKKENGKQSGPCQNPPSVILPGPAVESDPPEDGQP